MIIGAIRSFVFLYKIFNLLANSLEEIPNVSFQKFSHFPYHILISENTISKVIFTAQLKRIGDHCDIDFKI